MNKLAILLFLVYCALLAVFLLTGSLSGGAAGLLFAVGLLVFGLASRWFRS